MLVVSAVMVVIYVAADATLLVISRTTKSKFDEDWLFNWDRPSGLKNDQVLERVTSAACAQPAAMSIRVDRTIRVFFMMVSVGLLVWGHALGDRWQNQENQMHARCFFLNLFATTFDHQHRAQSDPQ